MKYTRDQVKVMTQDEYESALCKELNAAGFRNEFHGEYHEYQPDESTFGGAIVFDSKAVDYLRNIGLIDIMYVNHAISNMLNKKEPKEDVAVAWVLS